MKQKPINQICFAPLEKRPRGWECCDKCGAKLGEGRQSIAYKEKIICICKGCHLELLNYKRGSYPE